MKHLPILLVLCLLIISCQKENLLQETSQLPATDKNILIDTDLENRSFAGIDGKVWDDLDGDGIQDFTEPKIEGAIVRVFNEASGIILAELMTNSEGKYFVNLDPEIRFYIQVDLSLTEEFKKYLPSYQVANSTLKKLNSDFTDENGYMTSSTFNSSYARTLDFGVLKGAAVGNTVWLDHSTLGFANIFDADDTPMEGIKVLLYRVDVTGFNEEFISSTETNEFGNYLFENLFPGLYFIEFEMNDPTLQEITPNVGSNLNDKVDSDIEIVLGNGLFRTGIIYLGVGEINLTVDAGFDEGWDCGPWGDPKVPITGVVWNDLNRDGLRQRNEDVLSSVHLKLYNSGNQLEGTQYSNSLGEYEFMATLKSNYYIKVDTAPNVDVSKYTPDADELINNDIDPNTNRSARILIDFEIVNIDVGLFYTHNSLQTTEEYSEFSGIKK